MDYKKKADFKFDKVPEYFGSDKMLNGFNIKIIISN